ncbi:MAG: hypothetical protein RIC16_05080 [Rhodospirillales bacterium]
MNTRTLLIAAAIVAAVVFGGTYYAIERSTEGARREATEVYALIRDEIANVVAEAETTLDGLAADPATLVDDPEACGEPLAAALAANPEIYDVFLRIQANGTLDCTPGGGGMSIDFSNRLYYSKAVEEGRFVVGEFLIGKVSQEQVLAVARPVFDDAGDIAFVLVCGLKTGWLQAVIDQHRTDSDLIVEIADSSGVLLSYFLGESTGGQSAANKVELVRLPLLPGRSPAEVIIYTRT